MKLSDRVSNFIARMNRHEETKSKAIELRKKGYSVEKIAQILSIPEASVLSYVKDI